jgi:uncharacterized protein
MEVNMEEYKNNIIFEYDKTQYNVPLVKPWEVYTGNEVKDYDDYSKFVDKELDDLNYFTLNITEKCNLKCTYCFEKNKGTKNIDIESIYDFTKFIKSLNLNNINIRLFGGEPLLDLKLLEKILIILDKELVQNGININYNIFTNGTTLNGKALEVLNKYNIFIFVSIDGCKESHDCNRLDANGDGSYDTIMGNIIENNDLINNVLVRTILNPFDEKASLVDIMRNLTKNGLNKVSIEFPWVEKKQNSALNQKAVDIMKGSIRDYGYNYIQSVKNSDFSLIGLQPFSKIISNLLNKKLSMHSHSCSIGCSSVAISVDGEIFPCHSFVGMPEYKMGDLKDGIVNQNLKNTFLSYSADTIDACRKCPIKYLCSRRCAADSFFFNKSIYSPNMYRCELQKEMFKTSIYIYNELKKLPNQKRIIKLLYNKFEGIYNNA